MVVIFSKEYFTYLHNSIQRSSVDFCHRDPSLLLDRHSPPFLRKYHRPLRNFFRLGRHARRSSYQLKQYAKPYKLMHVSYITCNAHYYT